MKQQKGIVFAIIFATVLLSGWFGWQVKQRLTGPQVDMQSVSPEPALTLRAGYVAGAPPESPDSPAWRTVEAVEVPLGFQVLAIPWSRASKPPLRARALRTADRIYFLLEWPDPTEDRQTGIPQRFADAAAIMFPLKVEQPVTLMMGFLGPAEIWQWKADWDQRFWASAAPHAAYADFYPFDADPAFHPAQFSGNLRASGKPESAVETLTADGPGTVRTKARQRVHGRGLWKDGRWQAVMSRALAAQGADEYAFSSGPARRRIAFAVWDGAQGERGARKSISEWVWLELGESGAQTAAAELGPSRR